MKIAWSCLETYHRGKQARLGSSRLEIKNKENVFKKKNKPREVERRNVLGEKNKEEPKLLLGDERGR